MTIWNESAPKSFSFKLPWLTAVWQPNIADHCDQPENFYVSLIKKSAILSRSRILSTFAILMAASGIAETSEVAGF